MSDSWERKEERERELERGVKLEKMVGRRRRRQWRRAEKTSEMLGQCRSGGGQTLCMDSPQQAEECSV